MHTRTHFTFVGNRNNDVGTGCYVIIVISATNAYTFTGRKMLSVLHPPIFCIFIMSLVHSRSFIPQLSSVLWTTWPALRTTIALVLRISSTGFLFIYNFPSGTCRSVAVRQYRYAARRCPKQSPPIPGTATTASCLMKRKSTCQTWTSRKTSCKHLYQQVLPEALVS